MKYLGLGRNGFAPARIIDESKSAANTFTLLATIWLSKPSSQHSNPTIKTKDYVRNAIHRKLLFIVGDTTKTVQPKGIAAKIAEKHFPTETDLKA